MIGGKLIAEGGYGCVFHPAFDEIGNELLDEKFATKIQKENSSALNEIKIGKLISKIDGYINHFSPIIQDSSLNVKKFNFNKYKKCSILKSETKKNNFVLMKLDYIKGQPFIDYIIEHKNSIQVINTLIHSYNHLIQAISILIQHNIIHFDLKGDNILFDEFRKIPILIDYGLSMAINNINEISMNKDFLQEYFYVFAPEYYIWPIEVHYLCYILNENEICTIEDLSNIVDKYVSENPALSNFSNKFIKKYKEKTLHQLKYYNRFNSNERVLKIIQHWNTWDNYALSILYLKFLRYLNITGFDNNKFTIYFSQLLLHNIDPDPLKRYTTEKTKYEFNKFLFDEKVNNIVTFKRVTKSFIKNRKYFDSALKLNKVNHKTLDKLIKKT